MTHSDAPVELVARALWAQKADLSDEWPIAKNVRAFGGGDITTKHVEKWMDIDA